VVDQRTVLLLHYHEMKEDPLYNFLEISHFLGMDLTTEHIRGVIANTSVNAMHKLEEHHDLPHTNRFVVRGCAPTDVQGYHALLRVHGFGCAICLRCA